MPVAELRGETDEAAGIYQEAAERWAEFGFVLERAHALLGMGRCLCALQRGHEALPPLAEARALFARLTGGASVHPRWRGWPSGAA